MIIQGRVFMAKQIKPKTPRRIIVCLDGTANEVSDRQTHVVRIFRGLKKTQQQKVHYIQGVGTMQGQVLRDDGGMSIWRLLGLVFGTGLEDNVLNGYRYICETYDHAAHEVYDASATVDLRDQISLVGFSRGAYTARVLAGFINAFGLLHPDDLHMAPQIFRAYRILQVNDAKDRFREDYKALRRFAQVFRPITVPIDTLVLFDTVSAHFHFRSMLQTFWRKQSIITFDAHAYTTKNPSVRNVLHAVSIDEKRSFYRPLLWEGRDYFGNNFSKKPEDREDQHVREAWFAGYHSDIGGSALEDQAGVGKITLSWALDQMDDLDLKWDWYRGYWATEIQGKGRYRETVDERTKSVPDPTAPIHDSMVNGWQILEWIPKTLWRKAVPATKTRFPFWYLPRSEPRLMTKETLVHPSVCDRMAHGPSNYAPENLPDTACKDTQSNDPALYHPSYSGPASVGGDR